MHLIVRALVVVLILAPSVASAGSALTARQLAQHVLRRFAFAASPEDVDAVVAEGLPAWLTAQENPGSLDDSGSQLEFPPTTLDSSGGYVDYNIFERGLMQHLMMTPRQLQAKLELQWLDHFSVSLAKVFDPALIYHYDQTIRALGLGNFTTLMTAVAKEPAMLVWLDNNGNAGPVANENFARECMQLYMMGTTQLNMDGSPMLDSGGVPVPNYTQADVQFVAKAITGYGVYVDKTNPNPETRSTTQYYPQNHYTGAVHFLGAARRVPTDGTAIDYVMGVLSHEPSVAPFMAKELLQRFVTETPSPQYIADIAAVWKAEQDAPDQIAQVITAIVMHPDFAAEYHAMPKQPVEMLVGALRQLPGVMRAEGLKVPHASLLWQLGDLQQDPFDPPSVFGFYRPGSLATMYNTASTVTYTAAFFSITGNNPALATTDTFISIPDLRARIGSTDGLVIARYLQDATLDGGSPGVFQQIRTYLGDTPTDARITGTIWLLLNAPDYAVN